MQHADIERILQLSPVMPALSRRTQPDPVRPCSTPCARAASGSRRRRSWRQRRRLELNPVPSVEPLFRSHRAKRTAMPSRARLLSLCAALVMVAITGCASNRMAATAPPGIRLAGNWALDPAASEDIDQVIAHLRAEISKASHARPARAGGGFGAGPRRRVMRRREHGASSGAGRTAPRASAAAAGFSPAPGAALIQQFLSNVPGNDLTVTITQNSFTVTSGASSQQYTPGVQAAVEWGQVSAEQTSGWRGRRYVIDTRPAWGPASTQSYGLAPDGMLVMTLRLHGKGIDATLTRRYRRTNRAAATLLPTDD